MQRLTLFSMDQRNFPIKVTPEIGNSLVLVGGSLKKIAKECFANRVFL